VVVVVLLRLLLPLMRMMLRELQVRRLGRKRLRRVEV